MTGIDARGSRRMHVSKPAACWIRTVKIGSLCVRAEVNDLNACVVKLIRACQSRHRVSNGRQPDSLDDFHFVNALLCTGLCCRVSNRYCVVDVATKRASYRDQMLSLATVRLSAPGDTRTIPSMRRR